MNRIREFQSPLGDFLYCQELQEDGTPIFKFSFQSPLGDYLYCQHTDKDVDRLLSLSVSVPVRGLFILSELNNSSGINPL